MKRLSISQARSLIKRELGLSAASLTASPDMNGNPDYPWFTLYSGTQNIAVYMKDVQQGKYTDRMVALRITHENSLKGTTEYFYGDNLEFAEIYTEWRNREALAEILFCEIKDYPQIDPVEERLKSESMDDCWNHFHGQGQRISKDVTVLNAARV